MIALRGLLRLQIALTRFGVMRSICILLILASLAIWGVWLPALQRRDTSDQRSLALLQQRLAAQPPRVVAVALGPDRVADFYDALGDRRHAGQQLKTIFSLAQKHGVAIAAAEYKTGFDKVSNIYSWQIALPVRGSYAALRQFAEHVLLAIPFAALDELRIKRDAISSPQLDARLRFTLYLTDTPNGGGERDR